MATAVGHAQALVALGRPGEAQEELRWVIDDLPQELGEQSSLYLRSIFLLGQTSAQLGQYEEALERRAGLWCLAQDDGRQSHDSGSRCNNPRQGRETGPQVPQSPSAASVLLCHVGGGCIEPYRQDGDLQFTDGGNCDGVAALPSSIEPTRSQPSKLIVSSVQCFDTGLTVLDPVAKSFGLLLFLVDVSQALFQRGHFAEPPHAAGFIQPLVGVGLDLQQTRDLREVQSQRGAPNAGLTEMILKSLSDHRTLVRSPRVSPTNSRRRVFGVLRYLAREGGFQATACGGVSRGRCTQSLRAM